MKTLFISIATVLLLAAVGAFTVNARAQEAKVTKEIKVTPFTRIRMTAVGNIYFVQASRPSLRIEGKEKYVNLFTTRVDDDELVISMKNQKKNRNVKGGVDIYISAPDLDELDFEGVGQFLCNEPLKLDEVELNFQGVGQLEVKQLVCRTAELDFQGVGEAKVHVECDYLKARMQGVGSVKLSGRAGEADIHRAGIGSIDKANLTIGK